MKTQLLNFWEKRIMSMDVPDWFLFAQVVFLSVVGVLSFGYYME